MKLFDEKEIQPTEQMVELFFHVVIVYLCMCNIEK